VPLTEMGNIGSTPDLGSNVILGCIEFIVSMEHLYRDVGKEIV